MKKLLLAGFYLLIGLQAISQTTFSAVVKKYIDYDTSVITFTHCRLCRCQTPQGAGEDQTEWSSATE